MSAGRIRRVRTGGRVRRFDGLPFQAVRHVSGPIGPGTVVLSVSTGRIHAWLGVVLRVRKNRNGRVTHVWTTNVWTRRCRAGMTWETRRGLPVSRADIVDAIERHHQQQGGTP